MTSEQTQLHLATDTVVAFSEALSAALEHFQDAHFLGEQSPLATPYLLGSYLTDDQPDARKRGEALQQVLRLAADDMNYDEADLHRTILRERFFNGRTAAEVRDLDGINLGKTQYFAHQKRALANFEPYVVDRLNPALRLDRPLANIPELLDRARHIDRCLLHLKNGKTVMITGPSGTGKTSSASLLAQQWGEDVVWFTVRPGINDHVGSFLFDLGYFCHLHGSSLLWQELIAGGGQTKLERITGVVRHTLTQLPRKPLICIDEVDVLRPADDGNHAQLLQLFTTLHGQAAVLFIGQNASMAADHYEALGGLSPTLASVLFKRAGLVLSDGDLQRLVEYTNGNPRLLELSTIICQDGDPSSELFYRLPQAPPLPFLLSRILQRMSAQEIGVLMELAVFQTPAPADAWQREATTAHALVLLQQKHLAQFDTRGGVFLLPAYREAIEADIPEQKRFELHRRAARLFEQRAQYTLATFHLSRTDTPETAVWTWRDVQQQEINRGHAYAALSLFRALDKEKLSTEAREQVVVFCATLENLVGSPARAQDDLRSILVRTPLLQIEADELGGVIANNQSELDEAERLFRRAMSTAEQLLEVRMAYIRKGLAWRYRSERDLARAWQSISLAQYEVENLQGVIQMERRDYEAAIETLTSALALAQRFKHEDGIAKTYNNLGRIYTMIGRFAEAEHAFEEAERTYQQIGKLAALDGMRINRSFLYNLAGEYDKAVQLVEQLREDKKRHGQDLPPLWIALIAQNLAEAFLGKKLLNDAEHQVKQAMEQEEISILPDSLRTFGEIKLHQGEQGEAEQWVQRSIDLLLQNEHPDYYLLGYAYRTLAQIHVARKDLDRAAQAQTQAIELFTEINLPNEVEKTLHILDMPSA